jgi:glycosyltransferase involved in cell wall biosynthesis
MNNPDKHIKRVFIADPSFQDWLGHHVPYDFAVREGLEKAGVETIILANKVVTIDDTCAGIRVEKVFSRTAWGVKTGKCKNTISHKILILFSKFAGIPYFLYFLYSRISIWRICAFLLNWFIPPLLRRIPAWIYIFIKNWLFPPIIAKAFLLSGQGIRKILFSFANLKAQLKLVIKNTLREMCPPHWVAWGLVWSCLKDYYELVEALNKYSFGSRDILFSHMITNSNLPVWALFASRLARRKSRKNRGELVFLFRYPGYFLRPDSLKNKVWFRLIEKGFESGCLRGATDSSLLAREYANFLILPLLVYPIPHIPEYTVRYPDIRRNPLRCMSLGNARDEKGIMEIFDAIRILNANGCGSDFLFSLQVHNPDAASAAEVERFYREAPPNVELYREALPSEDYAELIAKADVILVPYWSDVYASRTSGVLLEALVSSKIIITTSGSWMEHEALHFRAGAEFVPSRNPDALAHALRRIAQNPKSHFNKAALAALKAREFHNPDMFAAFLLNGPQKKPLHARDPVLICYPWGNLFEGKSGASTRMFYLSKMLDVYKLTFFVPWQQGEASYQVRFYNDASKSFFYFYNRIVEKLFEIADRKASFLIPYFRNRIRDRNFRATALQSLLVSKAVIVEYPFYMKTIAPLAKALGLPVMMTVHDRHASLAANALSRKMFDRWEKDAARRADIVFTVADFEHEYFQRDGIVNILAPSTCDIASMRKKVETIEDTVQIVHQYTGFYFADGFFLFVGSLHGPNIVAKEAIKKIAAQAKAKGLPWHFIIAGGCANSGETVDNFHALGPVSEALLIALYDQCSLIISPLPYGTGASVKTVEAMGIGKVIFGSSSTFRGLSVTDGVECFIEDNQDNYIPRLEGLLLRPDSANILRSVGKKAEQFAAYYDYRICLRPYLEFLKSWPSGRQTVLSFQDSFVVTDQIK